MFTSPQFAWTSLAGKSNFSAVNLHQRMYQIIISFYVHYQYILGPNINGHFIRYQDTRSLAYIMFCNKNLHTGVYNKIYPFNNHRSVFNLLDIDPADVSEP